MNVELKSPVDERATIQVPVEVARLQTPFNGTVCSQEGDEYPVKQNIIDLIGSKSVSGTIAQFSNHLKLTAAAYEDLWRKRSITLLSGEDFPIEKEHELLIEWMMPQKKGLYLDIGCSTALYARAIKAAQPEADVIALDFSKQMLDEARTRSVDDQTDLYLLRADAREMPFFSKSFDGLMMGGTLNELSYELKVLFEARRVIKENGVFFVMHLLKAETWYGRLLQESAAIGGIQFWSLSESNDLFKRAGFKVDEQVTRGIVCFTKLKAV